MKKYISIFCIMVFVICLVSCNNLSNDEQADYFYKINQLIRDLDFNTAKVRDSKIILYNRESDIISEIEFEEYDSKFRLQYIYKSGAEVRFSTYATSGDEEGIVFVNDDSDSIMMGKQYLERVGHGKSYKYRTYK